MVFIKGVDKRFEDLSPLVYQEANLLKEKKWNWKESKNSSFIEKDTFWNLIRDLTRNFKPSILIPK